MDKRSNYLSLIRRTGYEKVPIDFSMCPSLNQKFNDYLKMNNIDLDIGWAHTSVSDLQPAQISIDNFHDFYDYKLKDGVYIDIWGIAHEPGSEAAHHMTRMRHPMAPFDSVQQVSEYPFPDYSKSSRLNQAREVEDSIKNGYATVGIMQITIWETSWYLRGMENLMADMMSDDPIAEAILDKVTEIAVLRAEAFAKSGVDVIFLGDDIGMQKTILMSESLYCEQLKPRLKKVIDAAKKIRPDILIFYHSCGFVTPFIPHLIDAGIDVLNPIQPECMDFREIHALFGDKISFHGTIGTQTTMPFGTPDDVRRAVFENLEIAGDKGGLLVAPTHLLEPEVPIENIISYIKACADFK